MRHDESWHVRGDFKCGTRIFDSHDERHIGRVDALIWGNTYRVTFDNGFRGDIPKRRARRAALED